MYADNCPKCSVSWVGDEIPLSNRHLYNKRTHFTRAVAVHTNNGDPVWRCPDCSSLFNLFNMQPVSERKSA